MNQEHHPRPVFWKKRTVADAVDALVTEDGVLTEVSKSTGLLEEGRGKTVSVSLVVDELRAHVVPQLYDRQQASTSSDTATYVVLETIGQ